MPKWTAQNIPDQSGRTAVVTGANAGLGFETASAVAAAGAHVVMAVRNAVKGNEAAERILAAAPGASVEVQPLDLGSLQSVRTAASDIKAAHPQIDLLINNAGVMYTPKGSTSDGFELHFGTNHLGHFALTGLLLDTLLPVPGSRVVTVSSLGHRNRAAIHFDDLNLDQGYGRVKAYGQSKLANLLFTYELQRRLTAAQAATISVAAHPGGSSTELGRHLPKVLEFAVMRLATQPPEMGALPTLRAATDPGVEGGQYYGPDGIGEVRGYPKLASSSKQSRDPELARRLWQVSEELTGVSYSIG
ncbi:SDR family NAD(P)-dependent oxidoreductase [Nocardia vaccinii]|uniref:SDR family NAD(P)-dependent oxidoreductase n=1 Tax=Nocardia vaccinii TaxID=1822 RepID=UPI00082BA486|nr:SDR family NAD(P)-dependent oxidoreductase [Nocardia vaccinii]